MERKTRLQYFMGALCLYTLTILIPLYYFKCVLGAF